MKLVLELGVYLREKVLELWGWFNLTPLKDIDLNFDGYPDIVEGHILYDLVDLSWAEILLGGGFIILLSYILISFIIDILP